MRNIIHIMITLVNSHEEIEMRLGRLKGRRRSFSAANDVR